MLINLFLNPSDAKYYAANSIYNEGELTMEGDLFDSEEIYFLQNDLCGRCGGARDHNGGSCRADGVICHNCNKKNHFSRKLSKDVQVLSFHPSRQNLEKNHISANIHRTDLRKVPFESVNRL